MSSNVRILVAKPGLDGHDRGAKVVAAALRDAGFEVIYTGLRQTPKQIALAAVQEDVDVVGVSILSGAHLTLVPEIIKELKDMHKDDVILFVGGIIPEEDIPELMKMGVKKVFGPGSATSEVIDFINKYVKDKK